jgi:hypothetical protein
LATADRDVADFEVVFAHRGKDTRWRACESDGLDERAWKGLSC